jgi:putative ABC transport system substrate-binding protein
MRTDTRWPTSTTEIRKYAAELVTLAPDVILATGSPNLSALLEATRAAPIVFVNVGDPGRWRLRREPGAAQRQRYRI